MCISRQKNTHFFKGVRGITRVLHFMNILILSAETLYAIACNLLREGNGGVEGCLHMSQHSITIGKS